MVKRLGFSVLCICLMGWLLSACGSSNNGNDSASNASPSSETTAPSEAPASADPQTQETLKLTWMIPTQQKIPVSDSVAMQAVMKKFNVQIDFTELPPDDQYPEKKKLLIASQSIPDIMTWTTRDEANLYGPQGAFAELTPYLDKMPNVKKMLDSDPDGKYNAYTTDGKLYRIPDYNVTTVPVFDFGYIKPEFDAVGVTKLDTWDDVYDGLKKLKEKYPDSYPFVVRGKDIGADNVKSLILLSFTQGKANEADLSGPSFDYDTKQYILGPSAPGYREGIEYLAKLYKEKLLDLEYFTTDTNALMGKLKDKKGFFLPDYTGGLAGNADVEKQLNDTLYPLELPGVAGGKRVLGHAGIKIGDRGTVINSKLSGDKLDRVLAIMDYLYSDEFYNLLYWNPDVTIEKDGQKMYKDVMYNRDPNYFDKYLPWSLMGSFQVNVQTMTKPGTAYADYVNNVYLNDANKDMWVPSRILPFTTDQTDTLKNLGTSVRDYFESNIDQFILGKKSFDEWDDFIAQLKSKGGDQMVDLYNQVNSQYFGS